jgi:hypothetical protein
MAGRTYVSFNKSMTLGEIKKQMGNYMLYFVSYVEPKPNEILFEVRKEQQKINVIYLF